METILLKGIIKPIPKQVSCSLPKRWRPISMMTIMYKIVAKVVANRLAPLLNRILTPHQHGFIKGRSIFYNILAAMAGIDYAQISMQECVLLQLNLYKAYDCIGWSFVTRTMAALGFGPKMSSVVLSLASGSFSQLLFN